MSDDGVTPDGTPPAEPADRLPFGILVEVEFLPGQEWANLTAKVTPGIPRQRVARALEIVVEALRAGESGVIEEVV